MEAELERFRKQKRLEERKTEVKASLNQYWDTFTGFWIRHLLPDGPSEPNKEEGQIHDGEEEEEEEEANPPWVLMVKRTLLTLTWLAFFMAFVALEFGAVFFAASLLFLLVWNTGTKGRRRGEVSAYSVFNKDCAPIDGTLDSQKLEKQLLFRS